MQFPEQAFIQITPRAHTCCSRMCCNDFTVRSRQFARDVKGVDLGSIAGNWATRWVVPGHTLAWGALHQCLSAHRSSVHWLRAHCIGCKGLAIFKELDFIGRPSIMPPSPRHVRRLLQLASTSLATCMFGSQVGRHTFPTTYTKNISGHPESNQGPSDCCRDLQSDALPTEL